MALLANNIDIGLRTDSNDDLTLVHRSVHNADPQYNVISVLLFQLLFRLKYCLFRYFSFTVSV